MAGIVIEDEPCILRTSLEFRAERFEDLDQCAPFHADPVARFWCLSLEIKLQHLGHGGRGDTQTLKVFGFDYKWL